MPEELAVPLGELVARAGVNPWVLRDDLAAGDPGAIGEMAGGWNTAADGAAQGTEVGRSASEQTGAAFTVDGAPAHDAPAAAQQTAQQLGLGGEEMRHVGRVLGDVSTELTSSTTAAEDAVSQLDARLQQVVAEYNRFMAENGPNLAPGAAEQTRENAINAMVELVRTFGGAVQGHVDTYEEMLNTAQRSLSGLGIGLDGDGDGQPDDEGAEVTLGTETTNEDGELGAFAGAKIADDGSTEVGGVALEGEYEAWAGANASAGVNTDNGFGGEASAQAGALAGTEGSAEVGVVGVEGRAETFVGAEANAEANFGPTGVDVGAGAFAGARAGVEGGAEAFGAGGKVEAEARWGLGVEGSLNAGIDEDGTWRLGGDAGVALGPGVKLGGEVTFNPGEFAEDVGELFGGEDDGPPPEDVGLDIFDPPPN